MAWAAGNFTRANGATEWQDDAALGIGIEPGVHDAQDNDLATGIDQCLNKTGQNSMTGDLNVGGNKVINTTRIGIGTTTPAQKLQIAETTNTTNIQLLSNTSNGAAATSAIYFQNDVSNPASYVVQNGSGNTTLAGANSLNIGTNGAYPVSFLTSGTERIRINSGGSVGIGVTNPGVLLDLRRDANDGLTRTRIHNNNNQSSAEVQLTFGNDADQNAAAIVLQSTANTSRAGVNSLNIINGLAAPIRVQAGASGGVDLASGGTSWSPVSDQRLKKNIEPLTYGLTQINQIEPVRFDYLEDSSNDSKRIGFIAQQLYPIVPEAVWGSEDTHFRASSTELIPVLVNAIKELSAKVEALEAQVQTLQPDTVLG